MKEGIFLKLTILLLISITLLSEEITFRGTNVENLMFIDKITPVLEADSLGGTKQKVEIEFRTNWKGLYVDIPVDMATTTGGISTEDILNALEGKINPTLLKSAIINVNDEEGSFFGSGGIIESIYNNTLPQEVLLDSISLNQIDIGAGGSGTSGESGKIFYDIVFVVGATSQTFASKGIDNTRQILKDWVIEYKDEIETDRFRINIVEHGGRKAYEDEYYKKNPKWTSPVVENYPASLEPYVTSAWNGKDEADTKVNEYDSMFVVSYNKWISPDLLLSTDANSPINLIGSLSNSSAYGSPGGENSAWGLYEAINFLEKNKRPEAQPVIFFVSNQPIALYGNGVNFLGSEFDYVSSGTEIFKPVGNNVEQKYKEAVEYEGRRPLIHQKAEEAMLTSLSTRINDLGIDFVLASSLSGQNEASILKVRLGEDFYEFNIDVDSLYHSARDLWDYSGSTHAVTFPLQFKKYIDADRFFEYESGDNENNLHSHLDEILEDYFRKKTLFQKWLLTYYSPHDKVFYRYKKVNYSIDDFRVELDDTIGIKVDTMLTKSSYTYLEDTYNIPATDLSTFNWFDRYYAAKELALSIKYTNPSYRSAFDKIMLFRNEDGNIQIEAIIEDSSSIGFSSEDKISYAYFTIDKLEGAKLNASATLDSLNNTITYRYTLSATDINLLENERTLTISLFSRITNDVNKRIVELNGDGGARIITAVDFIPPIVNIFAVNPEAYINLSYLKNLYGNSLFNLSQVESLTSAYTDNSISEPLYVTRGKDIEVEVVVEDRSISEATIKDFIINGLDKYVTLPIKETYTVPFDGNDSIYFKVENIKDDFGNRASNLALELIRLDEPRLGTIEPTNDYYNSPYTLSANGRFSEDERIVAIILPFKHDSSSIDNLPINTSSYNFNFMWTAFEKELGQEVDFGVTMPVMSDSGPGSVRYDGIYETLVLVAMNQSGQFSTFFDGGKLDLTTQTIDSSAQVFLTNKYRVDTIPPQLEFFRKTDVLLRDINGVVYNQFEKTLFLDDNNVTLTSFPGKSGDTYTLSTTDVSIDINTKEYIFTLSNNDTLGGIYTLSYNVSDLAGNSDTIKEKININELAPNPASLNPSSFTQLFIDDSNQFPFTNLKENLYAIGDAYANAIYDNQVKLANDFSLNYNKDYLMDNGLIEEDLYSFSQAGIVNLAKLTYVFDNEINYYNSKLIGTFIGERIDSTFEIDVYLRNISELSGLASVTLVEGNDNLDNITITPHDFSLIKSSTTPTPTPDNVGFVLGFTQINPRPTEKIKVKVTDKLGNEKELWVEVVTNDFLRIIGGSRGESKILESNIHINENDEINVDSVEVGRKDN